MLRWGRGDGGDGLLRRLQPEDLCKITVDYKGSLSLPVTVYDKPSRYDLVVKTDGGKATLARK